MLRNRFLPLSTRLSTVRSFVNPAASSVYLLQPSRTRSASHLAACALPAYGTPNLRQSDSPTGEPATQILSSSTSIPKDGSSAAASLTSAESRTLSRQAAQAIRNCVLQNNDQRRGYQILDSLYQMAQNQPHSQPRIPTRLATAALIHSLLRVNSPFRAAQIAETAWIGTNDQPKDFAQSMRLSWRTTNSILLALTAHATPQLYARGSHDTLPPPLEFPEPTPEETQHLEYLNHRAGPGEGADLPKTRLDKSTQRALVFLRVARNARQERRQSMYSRLMEVCILQGEIIVATLLFVLLVRDYQVRKMVGMAKQEYEAQMSNGQQQNREEGSITSSSAASWLSSLPPDTLSKLKNLEHVNIDRAMQLGLDRFDRPLSQTSAFLPVGGFLRHICNSLDLTSLPRAMNMDAPVEWREDWERSRVTVGRSGASNHEEATTPSIRQSQTAFVVAELAHLANDLALYRYTMIPDLLVRCTLIPQRLQLRVPARPLLLESYALTAFPPPNVPTSASQPSVTSNPPDDSDQEIMLSRLCDEALLTLISSANRDLNSGLSPGGCHELLQYAWLTGGRSLGMTMFESMRERGIKPSLKTCAVLISSMTSLRMHDAAKAVICVLRDRKIRIEGMEHISPIAKILIRGMVGTGEVVPVEAPAVPIPSKWARRNAKERARKARKAEKLVPEPSTFPPRPVTQSIPTEQQDNIAISLIYHATASGQASIIADLLPQILPHAFDHQLLYPETGASEAGLDLVASYGPKFYHELLNALYSDGHTGLAERVWELSLIASRHSWKMYTTKMFKRCTDEWSDSKVPLQISLNHRSELPSWPGHRRAPKRSKDDGTAWLDMPWSLDIKAHAIMMDIYSSERKRGLDIFDRPNHADERRIFTRGWGGQTFDHRSPRDPIRYVSTPGERRCDTAYRCAWKLHQSLVSMEPEMKDFVEDLWQDLCVEHVKRSSPASSDPALLEELDNLLRQILIKLGRSIPRPNERYFNAALSTFSRFDGMKVRVAPPSDLQDKARFYQQRYLQIEEYDPRSSALPRDTTALAHVKADLEAFGYRLPPAYAAREMDTRLDLVSPDQRADSIPGDETCRRPPYKEHVNPVSCEDEASWQQGHAPSSALGRLGSFPPPSQLDTPELVDACLAA